MTIPTSASKANFSLTPGTTFFLVEWDDNSTDENFFEVQLRIAPGIQSSFALLSYPLANENSFLWVFDLSAPGINIQQNQLVEFRVAACKGLRTNSGVATVTERSAFTTIGSVQYDSIPEVSFSAPTSFSAAIAPNSDGLLRMSWTDNSDKEETSEVFVKRTTDSSYPTSPYLTFGNFYFGRSPQDSLAFLKPGASYNVRLRARRATAWGVVSGQSQATANDYSGYSNEQTITIPALKAHTALVASAVDENTLKLDWTDNSDNETLTSIEYRIPSGSGLYQSLGTINTNTTTAGTVTFDHLPGLATDWQVKAGHQEGSNTPDYAVASNSVTYTLPFNPPTNLQASMAGNTVSSQSVVSLSWADNSAVETGYLIYARTTAPANGTFEVIKVVPTASATSTTVEPGFLPGTSYDFQVRAYFDNGNTSTQSNPSNTVVAVSKDGFTSAAYAPITLGQSFSYQLTTTTVAARTGWSVTGLPPGLTFNSSNGQVTGTPTEAGLFQCPMTATFADGWSVSGTLALRVLRPPAAPEKPVTITARTLPVGSVNVPLSILFSDLDTEAAVRMSTTVGNVDIVLQPTLTPQTYANFMAYANDPDAADNYNDAVFHRVSPGFVVQGGGYKPTPSEGADAFTEVTRKTSPINEPGLSNVAGTLALAKGSGVSSGTHDFFFNLGNNSSLDTVANNSFTAFGRVAGNGMSTTVQNIVNLPGQQYTVRIRSSGGTTFDSSNPLGSLGSNERWPINSGSAPSTMNNAQVVKINSITTLPVLTYAVTANSDTGNVSASISGSNLVLQGLQDAGTSTVTVAATDVDGNVTEQTFLVTVQDGFEVPQIMTQPQAQTVAQGADVTFFVVATGTGTLGYQWRKNGKDIASQTSSSLVLEDVTAADIADYSVVINNGATFIFSNSVHLTVNIPVTITADPVSITRNYGASATFTVAVTGDAPLTYQWIKGNTDIPMATSASYTINSLLMTDAGSYKVRVTNSVNNATSAAAVLTVNPIDTDNDGLYDHVELASNPATSPTNPDTDGDGFVDGLEVGAGTNPTLATSKPGSTVFYAQKDATSVLGSIAMKRTPSGNILNRLDNNVNVTVPELWLATYELTNQQFASILQRAKELDLILIATESGRRVVRYPKVSGEIVCYLANPAGATPESTDVDLDSVGSSFILPIAKVLEPASAVSWHGAYLCTAVLNQVHGYTSKNVPATWSYSTANGYHIPDYTAWELAARGGTAAPPLFGQLYPTGSTVTTAKANYNNAATGAAKKGGSYAVGKLGLFDMAGNLEEWIFQTDPNTPANGYTRGGSFADASSELLNTADESLIKTTISRRVGVRLALQASAAASFTAHPLAKFQRTDVPLTLTAAATGAPPLAYQWYKNNVAIKGKTGTSLTISSPVLADAGEYHVTVTTNGINAVLSSKAKVALVQAFTVPPLTTIAATKSTSFEAKPQGVAGQTFTYQWKVGLSPTNVPPDTQFINPVAKKLVMNNMQPSNTGIYTCEVKLAGQSALPAVTTQFELLVMQTPVIPAFNLPDGVVSGSFNYTLPQNSDETTGTTFWTVTGLPPGMTYNAATGVISGKPTTGGDAFMIKITARNLFGSSSTIVENLRIHFPDINAYGTFFGVVDRHVASGINDNLGGRLDVNITGTGKLTGSINLGTKLHRFTGALDNVPPIVSGTTVTHQNPSVTVLIPRAGLPTLRLFFRIKLSDKTLIDSTIGELGAGGSAPTTTAAITGWRNTWSKNFDPSSNYNAKRNVAFTIPAASIGVAGVPQGAGYATVTVDDAGKTTVSGKLADNTAMTSTGYLSPTGKIAHFQLLYSGKGSLVGTFNTAQFSHVVTGTDTLSWLRKSYGATSKERSYKLGFSTSLTAQGGVYDVPGAGSIMAGLDTISGGYPQNAGLTFSQGGLAITFNSLVASEFTQKFVITTSNIVQMPITALDNPQVVTFIPNKTTGAITGTFTVVNDDPTSTTTPKKQISRKVNYYALIVPKAAAPTKGIGYGYFTLYGLPASGGVTISNSDILSGKVVFDAVVP